ncbi:phage tail-collar fiber domain-containing protein [Acinetobacter guillouiae]|uniref:phage tail-collar fiber domain-containing protein n=1 Tax=Acinetobacter guillouiae TaxID=106649 RepID=UPI00125F2E20|nr:phage tail protein [Acinetobacter guillouiae]
MAEYYNVTTTIGDAEIAKAIATNTKLNITHIVFGDGNGSVPTPSKTRTTLVKEVYRQPITKYERHPTIGNWIIIETILPSNIGGFWIREMGVIANGKLISHGSHAPFEKVADPTGVSEYRLKFTLDIRDGNVVAITLDQSLIYATQAWVEENYIKRVEIVDDLLSDVSNKPLSAKQGKYLQDYKLDRSIDIPVNSDLNNYKSQGSYYVDLDVYAATIKNCPTDLSFTLQVDRTAGVIQRLTTYNGGGTKQYIRSYYTQWSTWYKLYSELDPQPTADAINNLDSVDVKKPLSANQGKILNEKKVEIGSSFSDSFANDVDFYQDHLTKQTFKSFDDFPLGTRVLVSKNINLLKAPNIADDFIYIETKTTYKKSAPGRHQFAIGCSTGEIAVRSASTNANYSEWKYIANTASNVASASKLKNVRKINTIDFDGTVDISIPTIDAIDNLDSIDAKKPLAANQGRILNEQKLNKTTEQNSFSTDKDFLDKYATRKTPSFFFDGGLGKFFNQYTVGVASSLDGGAYFVIGASPLNNQVKVMTGVRRDNGSYDLQKNITLLDSESNNVVNGSFVWNNHKSGGWARGLEFKAYPDSNIFSGFGAYGNTDTVERVYFGFGGENLWSVGNGKGIWIDQYKAFTNCNWEFSGAVSGSFIGNFDGSIQAKDIRNVSPLQIQGGKMGYYFAEYSGLRYGTATGATYGDFLALNGYGDSSGGKVNGLFFDKTNHQIYHFQNGYGTNNWGTPRQIAYTDSQIFTGTNKFTGDIQVAGPIYAQKFRGDGDFWFTSKDENSAKRLLTGGLLVSDAYIEAEKIPELGIYSKGHIQTAGGFASTNNEVQIHHSQTGRFLFLNSGAWGCYSQQGTIPLAVGNGGTGSISVAGAKTNLQINRLAQDPSVTSMYAPTTDSRIVITDNSWGVWSVNPNFNAALSTAHGGTGNTQGIAPSASKLQTPRRINNVNFDGTSDIEITAAMKYVGAVNATSIDNAVNDGFYQVMADGIAGLYGYGVLEVRTIGNTIHQTYYAHMKNVNGSVIVRQSWNGVGSFTPWRSLDPQGSVTLSGQLSGSGSFDDSGNLNISATVVQGLGINQTWRNVTSQRAANTTYTNNRPVPIQFAIYLEAAGNNAYANISVGGELLFAFSNTTAWGTSRGGEITVPPYTTYRVDGSFNKWSELT